MLSVYPRVEPAVCNYLADSSVFFFTQLHLVSDLQLPIASILALRTLTVVLENREQSKASHSFFISLANAFPPPLFSICESPFTFSRAIMARLFLALVLLSALCGLQTTHAAGRGLLQAAPNGTIASVVPVPSTVQGYLLATDGEMNGKVNHMSASNSP